MENGYIESFHGKFREECLNEHWFLTLEDARETIESWRLDYNQMRPHSSLGYRTPDEFARALGVPPTPSAAPQLQTTAAGSAMLLNQEPRSFSLSPD